MGSVYPLSTLYDYNSWLVYIGSDGHDSIFSPDWRTCSDPYNGAAVLKAKMSLYNNDHYFSVQCGKKCIICELYLLRTKFSQQGHNYAWWLTGILSIIIF